MNKNELNKTDLLESTDLFTLVLSVIIFTLSLDFDTGKWYPEEAKINPNDEKVDFK